MTIDTDKAKRALDHLQAERQAQNIRLQLAAQSKLRLDSNIAFHTVLLSKVEGLLSISNRVLSDN